MTLTSDDKTDDAGHPDDHRSDGHRAIGAVSTRLAAQVPRVLRGLANRAEKILEKRGWTPDATVAAPAADGPPPTAVAPRPPVRRVEDITWFHSIQLPDGRVTPGKKPPAELAAEAASLNVSQDLRGKTVLDIGAWDGYFSFEAERRGADRVVALDHYVWSTDLAGFEKYHRKMTGQGQTPLPPDQVPEVWDPVNLPGRAGFDLARTLLGSAVEPVVGDFLEVDPAEIGSFDIVFFLGVLYHLKDPFLALRWLRSVTRETAVIETAGVSIPGWSQEKLWMFFDADGLDSDPSNWWTPNGAGLVAMCKAAGFREARVILDSPEYAPPNPGYRVLHSRMTVHAYA